MFLAGSSKFFRETFLKKIEFGLARNLTAKPRKLSAKNAKKSSVRTGREVDCGLPKIFEKML
jgi:hypothetical protein